MSTSVSTNISLTTALPDSGQAAAPSSVSQDPVAEETRSAVAAPAFISPVIRVDNETGLALLVVRDTETGKTMEQYPSRLAVEEYKRHQQEATTVNKAPPASETATVPPATADADPSGATVSIAAQQVLAAQIAPNPLPPSLSVTASSSSAAVAAVTAVQPSRSTQGA